MKMQCTKKRLDEDIQININTSQLALQDSVALDLSFVDFGEQFKDSIQHEHNNFNGTQWQTLGLCPVSTYKDNYDAQMCCTQQHVARRCCSSEYQEDQPYRNINKGQDFRTGSDCSCPTQTSYNKNTSFNNDVIAFKDGLVKDNTIHQKDDSLNNEPYSDCKNNATFIVLSAIQLETLVYVVSVVLIVMAVVIVHLYMKIQTFEGYNRTPCICHEAKPTLLVMNQTTESANKKRSSKEFRSIESLLPTENSLEGSTWQKNNGIYFNKESSYVFSENPSGAHHQSRRLLESSSITENRESQTDVMSSDGGQFQPTRTIIYRQQNLLLRRTARSGKKSKTDSRTELIEEIYRRALKDHRIKVQSFQGNFSKIFNFSAHFLPRDNINYTQWGTGVIAYRDSSIFFPQRDTILKFYTETQQTATMKPGKKLVISSNTNLGVFQVTKHGHYLINLNTTLVDNDGTHFLALHLNGQAVLACAKGGFRCPHFNEENSSKYRICNINGLLELNKKDTLDVRTMQHNTTIRLDKRRMSYFSIVHLK